jgi:hypothetical protein
MQVTIEKKLFFLFLKYLSVKNTWVESGTFRLRTDYKGKVDSETLQGLFINKPKKELTSSCW